MKKGGLKLEIEPIPASTWGISLASRLDKEIWDEIRKSIYEDAGYRCIICKEGNEPLHCHEVWEFNNKARTQTLVGFQCLCKTCHDVKHFGRSKQVYPRHYIKELIKHWCKINKRSKEDFIIYEKQIFELNKKRANIFFTVKVEGRVLI